MNQGFDPSKPSSHQMTPGFLHAAHGGATVLRTLADMSDRVAGDGRMPASIMTSGRVVAPRWPGARVADRAHDAPCHHGQPIAPTGDGVLADPWARA